VTDTWDRRAGGRPGGVGRDLARDLLDGLVEIAVTAAAVLVVVGGGAGVGYVVGGGWGAVVGGAVGAVALGVGHVVLLLSGVSLAARLVRGRDSGTS
jgi:hypothetical protein